MATKKLWQLSIRIPTKMHQRWLAIIEKSERYKTVSSYVLDKMEKQPALEAENKALKKELQQLYKEKNDVQKTTMEALQAVIKIGKKIP